MDCVAFGQNVDGSSTPMEALQGHVVKTKQTKNKQTVEVSVIVI